MSDNNHTSEPTCTGDALRPYCRACVVPGTSQYQLATDRVAATRTVPGSQRKITNHWYQSSTWYCQVNYYYLHYYLPVQQVNKCRSTCRLRFYGVWQKYGQKVVSLVQVSGTSTSTSTLESCTYRRTSTILPVPVPYRTDTTLAVFGFLVPVYYYQKMLEGVLQTMRDLLFVTGVKSIFVGQCIKHSKFECV